MTTSTSDIQDALVALQPRLRRFAYGLTDEADELVQSAYERALTRLDQWRPGSRLDSWMYRIVQTIRINQLRSAKVRATHYAAVDPDTRCGSDGRTDMETQLTLDAVRGFIWSLSEEQRSVVLLVAVEGLSYKDASEVLGIPIGTVTSRLARARMAISEFVEGAQTQSERNLDEPIC